MAADRVLKEHKAGHPDSISALTLSHRALKDVSFLSHHFNNLERLNLRFNNLSSLEGLESCVNLKWLSVLQNKLQSLRGIERLSKLKVLNAGKNNLRSMDEVKDLVSLRAVNLNDNEIGSICRLDQMKELNTLVISRNPVRSIGESLAKVKTIKKLSLSKCQLKDIGTSLKSCSELKELRLSHNDIKGLPAELVHNTKLRNLDLGNNLLTNASDLKVLKSLQNLRNLNLQGNPVAEMAKLLQNVQNQVPNLKIFNDKPVDRSNGSRKGDRIGGSLHVSNEENTVKKSKKCSTSSQNVKSLSVDGHCDEEGVLNKLKEKKRKRHKSSDEQQHQKTDDLDTILALSLSYRALTDVSFLSHHFNNLERLHLCFNNLSSLEGLESCVNLKWLSVLQNKLQSLRGIERLSKLKELNAGKNNLRSMDEVKGLSSLGALILNDNEIGSICRLDRMKELNTLFLSRNPLRSIGESLAKVKTITKLSLSKCQIKDIGASLKSCSELKELQLSHNDIKGLPAELAHNTKLRNLDLGNNLLTNASDLKVLKSLQNLSNLNLQGNPFAEMAKLLQKVQNQVPNLKIFNDKPVDRSNGSRKGNRVGSCLHVSDAENTVKQSRKCRTSSQNIKSLSEDGHCDEEGVLNKLKEKKRKRHKISDEPHQEKNVLVKKVDNTVGSGQLQGKSKARMGEIDVFDDAETSLLELFVADTWGYPNVDIGNKKREGNSSAGDMIVVSAPKKRKRSRKHRNSDEQYHPKKNVSVMIEDNIVGGGQLQGKSKATAFLELFAADTRGHPNDDIGEKREGNSSAGDMIFVCAPKKRKKSWKHRNSDEQHHQKKNVSVKKVDNTVGSGQLQGKSKAGMGEIDAFDNGETSFLELFAADTGGHPNDDIGNKKKREGNDTFEEGNSSPGDMIVAPTPQKGKKQRKHCNRPKLETFAMDLIGLGGPSRWGNQ